MKQRITTILAIWVAAFVGLLLTVESLNFVFVLCLVVFAICSYELRYKENLK